MKKIFLIIIALVASIFSFAQSNDEIMAKLTQAAASMKSMQCNFTQNKTMSMLAEPTVSKGRMCYVAPDKMKWEYTDPYPFAIKVDGEKMTKISDGKEEILDTKNRMYQGMMKIIMSSATGKNLFDKSTHYSVYFEDAREEFGKKYDLGYLMMYGKGFFEPIVDLSIKYKKPLIYGMKPEITITYRPTDAAKIIFDYEIRNRETGEIHVTGRTIQVFMNKNNYQLVLTNPDFYEEWKKRWEVGK